MRWRLDPGQIEVVDEDVAAVLRTKSPAEKLAMIGESNHVGRMLMAGGIRLRHPDWTGAQVDREVARRMADDPT